MMMSGENGRATGGMMAGAVAGVNVLLLASAGLAAPAPITIGVFEIALVLTLGLAIVLALAGIVTGRARVQQRDQLGPLLLIPIIALPLLISVLVATARGVPFDAAVRGALPYVAFLPVVFLGLLVGPNRPGVVTGPLVAAGVAQSLYVLGLFVVSVANPTDTRAVWLSRITLLDPRTTVPLFLGGALLPLASLSRTLSLGGKVLRVVPLALGLTAALATQTRSQLAALLAGTAALVFLWAVWRAAREHRSRALAAARMAVVSLAVLVLVVGVLYLIPPTRALIEAIVLRTQTSLDTGRVADEWIPAVNTVLDQGLGGVLGGLGSGQTFITGSGEERTYIHNLVLYGLVYFGVPGLCLILITYLVLMSGVWHRARSSGDPRYLGLGSLVVALFAYAQFFAVHKLFTYNLMLALVAQALVQPRARGREA